MNVKKLGMYIRVNVKVPIIIGATGEVNVDRTLQIYLRTY